MSEAKQKDIRPVLIAYPATYSLLMLNFLVSIAKVKFVGIVLTDSHIKVKARNLSLIQSALRLIKISGLRYGLYMLFVSKCAYLILGIWNIVSMISGKSLKFKTFEKIAKEQKIPIFKSKNINNRKTSDFMKSIESNLIVSAYNNQILKYETCKQLKYKGINIHNSYLPDFAGLDAAFENLYQGVKAAGATIHYLDKDIDTGRIILQKKIDIQLKDTVFSLNIRQWLEGARMLPKVLESFKQGKVKTERQNSGQVEYPYHSFPECERVKAAMSKGKRLILLRQVIVPNSYLYQLFNKQ